MITIDLAFDKEIAKELAEYLTEQGIDSKLEDSLVSVNKTDFDARVLSTFLEKTNRIEHVIRKINVNSYLISKEASVEKLGLGTCEICGLVDFEEKLFSHRWTHGI